MGSETESLFLLSHLRQNLYRIDILIGCMYGIFTYIWFMFMKNIGKYTVTPYTGKKTVGFGISG